MGLNFGLDSNGIRRHTSASLRSSNKRPLHIDRQLTILTSSPFGIDDLPDFVYLCYSHKHLKIYFGCLVSGNNHFIYAYCLCDKLVWYSKIKSVAALSKKAGRLIVLSTLSRFSIPDFFFSTFFSEGMGYSFSSITRYFFRLNFAASKFK